MVAGGAPKATDEVMGAWFLVVGLFVPAALGVILTVGLLPIVVGLPLLVIFGRPWWTSLRVIRRRTGYSRSARAHIYIAVVVQTIGWAWAGLLGFDDFDSQTDLLFVLPMAQVAVSALGAWKIAAERSRPKAPQLRSF